MSNPTVCPACGDGELEWDEDAGWECPSCGDQFAGDEATGAEFEESDYMDDEA